MKKRSTRYLSILSVGCGVAFGAIGLLSLKPSSAPVPELECQKIVLKNSEGKPLLILDGSSGSAVVKFLDKKGQTNMELIGGDSPSVKIRNRNQNEMISIGLDKEEVPVVVLKDRNQIARMQIQGGDSPAIFLKNNQNEVVATMLLLQDGGAAVGLADKEGDVAAFMRGGVSPSISFFQKSVEPMTAIGISQNVPHLLIASPTTKDNIVLHGGDPTSMLFVDDKGEVPILLSKHGLFQGKKESSANGEQKEDKIFTLEDFINPLKDTKLDAR